MLEKSTLTHSLTLSKLLLMYPAVRESGLELFELDTVRHYVAQSQLFYPFTGCLASSILKPQAWEPNSRQSERKKLTEIRPLLPIVLANQQFPPFHAGSLLTLQLPAELLPDLQRARELRRVSIIIKHIHTLIQPLPRLALLALLSRYIISDKVRLEIRAAAGGVEDQIVSDLEFEKTDFFCGDEEGEFQKGGKEDGDVVAVHDEEVD